MEIPYSASAVELAQSHAFNHRVAAGWATVEPMDGCSVCDNKDGK
jgi:hypothetical protein